jgi:hypothetical protein
MRVVDEFTMRPSKVLRNVADEDGGVESEAGAGKI